MKQLKINVPKLLSNLNVVWHRDYKAIKVQLFWINKLACDGTIVRDKQAYSPAEYEATKATHRYC